MQEIKDKVREFILDAAQRHGLNIVSDDQSLTENGVIDSLTIFRLVSFLEDNFDIRIADDEIVGENFRSVSAIGSFVADKFKKKK